MAHSISTRLEKKLPICGHIHKILHGHVNSKPLGLVSQPWKSAQRIRAKVSFKPKHYSGYDKSISLRLHLALGQHEIH